MSNKISKTTFLKYLRCPRAAAFESESSSIVRDYQRDLAKANDQEKAKVFEEETKERLRQLFLDIISASENSGGEDEVDIESADFDSLLKDNQALKAMLGTYFKIEELSAEKAEHLYGGQVISGTRKNEQVIGQRYINHFKDGFNFNSYVDIYQSDDKTVRIIETKATTSKKYSDLGPTKDKVHFPLFEKSPFGVMRLQEDFEGFKPFEKYYENREKLLNRLDNLGRYVYDLAWQRYIIENSTEDKREHRYYLAVLNDEYYFDGKTNEKGENIYNADEAIVFIDLTEVTKDFLLIIDHDVQTVIDRINKPNFERVPLEASKCLIGKGYQECPWTRICKKDFRVPDKNSLYVYLNGHHGFGPPKEGKESFPKEKIEELIANGITHALDINYEWLSDTQKVQYEVIKNGREFVEKQFIAAFMKKELKYPLFHLDFETMNYPLPMFKGEKPYQQSIFQYSLHVERLPGVCDKEKDNFSFLSKGKDDDREQFIKSLIKNIPAKEQGTIIVYNAAFEKSRINELIKMFPQYETELASINERVFDLMNILKPNKDQRKEYEHLKTKPCNFNYYSEALQRSFSIKKVLPIFAPSLSYANLQEVHNGLEAQATFMRLKTLEGKAFDITYSNMIEYCKQDTWAMFEILQGLRKLIYEK